MSSILITGCCGVGKTWVMKKLLAEPNKPMKLGLFCFHECESRILVGKYTGKVFDGSDSLSMAVMRDLPKFKRYIEKSGKFVIFEGDRFSNSKFISYMSPVILRIGGDGEEGRKKRGSKQSLRHLKSISSRVNNIGHDHLFNTSEDCLRHIIEHY